MNRKDRTALNRVGLCAGSGLAAAVVVGFVAPWYVAPLVGWDVAAAAYLVVLLPRLWTMDARQTSRFASREDPTHAVADLVLLAAAVASLAAVAGILLAASHLGGAAKAMLVVLAVVSVMLSWATVHLTFLLRYARLYYTDPVGGIGFNQDERPAYTDFAYVAFTIGMTFQVSDTDLGNRAIRATALRHALLSYLFGTVILAVTVNVIAGLSH